mgnify:CR=1 FL=1
MKQNSAASRRQIVQIIGDLFSLAGAATFFHLAFVLRVSQPLTTAPVIVGVILFCMLVAFGLLTYALSSREPASDGTILAVLIAGTAVLIYWQGNLSLSVSTATSYGALCVTSLGLIIIRTFNDVENSQSH